MLAEQLIAQTFAKQKVAPGELTLHADRGTSMRSKMVAELLVDLEVTKSHSRPYVSDDNPYSEAHFKTLKYRPEFPPRFGCIEDARAHCQEFFPWYNDTHRHSGNGYMTPAASKLKRRSLTTTNPKIRNEGCPGGFLMTFELIKASVETEKTCMPSGRYQLVGSLVFPALKFFPNLN